MMIERLHSKHLRDGRKRTFEIVGQYPTHLLLREHGSETHWFFDPPLSMQRIIDDFIKERGTLVGCTLIGEMQKDKLVTLRWQIK